MPCLAVVGTGYSSAFQEQVPTVTGQWCVLGLTCIFDVLVDIVAARRGIRDVIMGNKIDLEVRKGRKTLG